MDWFGSAEGIRCDLSFEIPMYAHALFQVKDIVDERGLIPEFKKVVEDRLDLYDLLVDELKTEESRIARMKDLLNEWPTTPFPSVDAVLPLVTVRGRLEGLKMSATSELLAASVDTIKAALNCWTLLQANAKRALVEVQKAVRDTAKREKKKEKDAETARRREEKKQKAALDKKNSEAAAGAGAAGGKDGNRFWEMIFGDADRVLSCKLGTPVDLKKWDVFFEPMHFTALEAASRAAGDAVAGKASLFLQQYAGSATGRNGRCFLRVGDSDTQLHAFYMDLVKRSKPITPAG